MTKYFPCICGHMHTDSSVKGYIFDPPSNNGCFIVDGKGKYLCYCKEYRPSNLEYFKQKFEELSK